MPRDTTLLVSASRPVAYPSTSGVQVRSAQGEVEGVLDISSDGRILFWRPTTILDAQVEHRVTISGVRDARGAPFDDHTSTFVTGVFSYVDLKLPAD